jgi:acyl-CoA synthetase (AMP-forming)/AMP-acid ligase II
LLDLLPDLLPDHVHHHSTHSAMPRCDVPTDANRATSTVPAVSDGGLLELAADEPILLGDTLVRAAHAESPKGIVYADPDNGDEFQTYNSLLDEAQRTLTGLRAAGLKPGDPVVLQLARHRDFIAAFWACVLGGFVPVPLAVAASYDKPSASMQSLAGVWETLCRPAVIVERRTERDFCRAASRLELASVRALAIEDLRREPDMRHHGGDPGDIALLMLTSGSTGTPKAVALTHRNLLSRCAGSRQLNGFSSTDITVNWMPLDHVAGLIYFHTRDVYLGCRQVHIPTEAVLQDPLLWLRCLEQQRATVTFAPNFAYGLVNDQEQRLRSLHVDLSSVRCVLNGAEAIVARTARRFLALLEPCALSADAMQPAWGMSETSSGVTYGGFSLATSSDADEFVEVGRPIPGVSIRIVDAGNIPVGEGAVGRLQVRGTTVTTGYFGSPEITRAAFTPDGWFDTGDLGIIVDGRLTITGREKDVVIINSVNYYCHAIESVVETVDDVEPSYTAACAVRRAGANTDSLAIFFHPRAETGRGLGEILKRIRLEVSAKFGIGPEYLLPVAREAIPKTSLGKIQRSELGRRLLAGDHDETLKLVERMTASPNTLPDWFFRKAWQRGRNATEKSRLFETAVVLVFMDREGVGVELLRRLVAAGTTCIAVEAAGSFATAGPSAYNINPGRDGDYAALFNDVRERGLVPSHVVQLWGYGQPVDVSSEAISAMRLAKALAKFGNTRPVRMIFVGSEVQHVRARDTVACEKATVLGILKSIPQEIPSVQCRHVDVEPTDAGSVAGWIVDEMSTPRSEREVAYRDGQRLVAYLEKVAVASEAPRGSAIEVDGFYLVTGGTGGMGTLVAAELLERFHARLLLIGRRELEGDRKLAVDTLRRSGQIAYEAADVCDADRMAELVRQYEAQWGRPLRGVFHFAGEYREQLSRDEDAASFLAVLRPKTMGTAVVHRLLTERGGGLLVCASSLAGFFGGATIGAYSSASAFQDAFAEQHDGRDGVECRSLAWSNWDGVGQSRALQIRDLPRSRGYQPMQPRQALQSLLIGLSRRDPTLIIGIDGDHPHIRRYRRDDASVIESVHVY